jgi:GMP synthase PP-ATPase subunit
MRIRDLEQEEKNAIAREVLKNAGYRCTSCGVKKGALAWTNSSKKYVEVDEFEADFMRNQGIKIVKVFLRVIKVGTSETSPYTDEYKVLCALCSQDYIKAKIAETRKKKLGKLSEVRMMHVKEVRNYIFCVTGKMVSIDDAIGLYLRVYSVLNSK